jgi:hypothetical protein
LSIADFIASNGRMVDDWIGDDVKERGRCSVRVKKPAKSLSENSGLRVRTPDTVLLLLLG